MPTDWKNWEPTMRATLLFVVQDDRILLIRKKTGFGKGTIKGPGGKLECGESYLECAVREVDEELCIRVGDPQQVGELHFQFTDGLAMHVAVFVATQFEGEPTETVEAAPLWFAHDSIPYHEMWADDIYWLPALIRGQTFRAWFDFDGKAMLSRKLVLDGNNLAASRAAG